MTQKIPIAAVQPSRKSYGFQLVMLLLGMGVWVWLLLSRRPPTKQLNHGDIVAVCCFYGAGMLYLGQIMRRLARPDRALLRAVAMNRWIERHPLPWLEWAAWVCSLGMFAVMFIGVVSPNSFHLHLRVWLIYGVFCLVAALLRDMALIGIALDEDMWPKARSVAELKPITSEHWGDN